ncbi:MAG: uroporphyrinogen-III synthase, partial [Alphaproteobacteria bacterium]
MNTERRRRALITRPQEDAAAVAVALAQRGITPVLAPMMQTEFEPADIDADLARAQAVLFTSRNGVRAFSRVSDRRDVPVFAVGDSTADLARDNGFSTVESAGGDSTDLARLVAERLNPSEGPLLHIAGKTVAGDLSGALASDGLEVVRQTLYDAKPVRALTAETAAAIRNNEIDYVLFFSPRTARVFSDLVAAAGLTAQCRNFEAICLSEAVATELASSDWKVRRTAAAPTSEALLRTVDDATGGGTPESVDAGKVSSAAPKSPFAREPMPAPDSDDPSDPVDLGPLQKAIQRAAARADAPTPATGMPPAPAEDAAEAEDTAMDDAPADVPADISADMPDDPAPADPLSAKPEEPADPAASGGDEPPPADPVDPPPPSDDDDKPTSESSMT